MMKLKVIAFFLSLLLLVQVLPVQQIGKALSQNQWTEEQAPHGDECPGKCDFQMLHPFLPPNNFTEISTLQTLNNALAYIHHSAQIPHNHSLDIFIPPPDYCLA